MVTRLSEADKSPPIGFTFYVNHLYVVGRTLILAVFVLLGKLISRLLYLSLLSLRSQQHQLVSSQHYIIIFIFMHTTQPIF